MLRQRRKHRLQNRGERASHTDFEHSMVSRSAQEERRSRPIGGVLGKGQRFHNSRENIVREGDVLFRYALCFFLNSALASPILVARLILRFLAIVSSP